MAPRLVLCLALLSGCGQDDAVPIPETCNGHVELCARRFDEVAYPTTHNAMASDEDVFFNANQRHGIARQLEDGVRALMLDIYLDEGTLYLCHSDCVLGEIELARDLDVIARFLHEHRGDVVSLLIEPYVTPAELEPALRDAGLLALARAQAPGAPWPTLRELVDADERLVLLSQDGGGAYPWYLDMWTFVWDTPYDFTTPSEFSCTLNRGDPENSLFLVNHWLSGMIHADAAVEANALLAERVTQCRTETGRLPNFVAVDYYDVGDLFSVVDGLNGL